MGLASFRRTRTAHRAQPPSQISRQEHSRAIQELTVRYEKEISHLKSGSHTDPDPDPERSAEEIALRDDLYTALCAAGGELPGIHFRVLEHLALTLDMDTLEEFVDFVEAKGVPSPDGADSSPETPPVSLDGDPADLLDLPPKDESQDEALNGEPKPITEPEFVCPDCDKVCQNEAGLRSHIRAKHTPDEG